MFYFRLIVNIIRCLQLYKTNLPRQPVAKCDFLFQSDSTVFEGQLSNGGRRAPVRLLVAPNNEEAATNDGGTTTARPGNYPAITSMSVTLLNNTEPASAKPIASPRKKCRSSPKYTLVEGAERQRPSLNFEKMRREVCIY